MVGSNLAPAPSHPSHLSPSVFVLHAVTTLHTAQGGRNQSHSFGKKINKKNASSYAGKAGRQTGGSAEDLSPLELLCYGICDELSPLTSRKRKRIASQIQSAHSCSPRQVLLRSGTGRLSQRARQRRFTAVFRAG